MNIIEAVEQMKQGQICESNDKLYKYNKETTCLNNEFLVKYKLTYWVDAGGFSLDEIDGNWEVKEQEPIIDFSKYIHKIDNAIVIRGDDFSLYTYPETSLSLKIYKHLKHNFGKVKYEKCKVEDLKVNDVFITVIKSGDFRVNHFFVATGRNRGCLNFIYINNLNGVNTLDNGYIQNKNIEVYRFLRE